MRILGGPEPVIEIKINQLLLYLPLFHIQVQAHVLLQGSVKHTKVQGIWDLFTQRDVENLILLKLKLFDGTRRLLFIF